MTTQKQAELLEFVRTYANAKGYSPSYDEMMVAMGLASKGGIHRMIVALEAHGQIRRVRHSSRSVEVVRASHSAVRIGMIDRLVAKAMRTHSFDDGDGPVMIITEAELRALLMEHL